jgi:hypothetical protein
MFTPPTEPPALSDNSLVNETEVPSATEMLQGLGDCSQFTTSETFVNLDFVDFPSPFLLNPEHVASRLVIF